MVIKPRVRGFFCVTAHPAGCAAHVREQIDHVRAQGMVSRGPGKALIIGASTGYGLSSRIQAAFGSGASTLGIYFERPSEEERPATAGWYNSLGFEQEARRAGLYARSINGDAFSDDIKARAIEMIRRDLGKVDLVIYSVAAPRRTHPRTGVMHMSVLKPVGTRYHSKTLDTDTGIVSDITLEPAKPQEVADTIAVMGGEDWELWMNALGEAGVLAPGCTTLSYSYIGPEITWPVYRNGTIGIAKLDLEASARRIDAMLSRHGGRAFISVNKALVTQASSAIPVVPLYIAILYKVMKAKGLHEGCIEQVRRLFARHLYNGSAPVLDTDGRIRLDDLEMRADVQEETMAIWPEVTTENVGGLTDLEGYRAEFLKLFGFGLPGVDYEASIDPHIAAFPG